MTLGILIYSLGGGGAERVVSNLLNYFHSKKLNVVLIMMNRKIVYDIPKDIPIYYIDESKVSESGFTKLAKVPLLAYKYAMLCKKKNITHSLSLMTRPNYINILSRFFHKGPKRIISERAFPSLQYGYGDLKSQINKVLIKKTYKKADLVIANSNGNASDLVANFQVPKTIIDVIYNPIDLSKVEKSGIKQDFFDPNYINLITVGRLDAGKNHKMLIEAIADQKNIRLYILGDGELRSELEGIINEKKLQDNVYLLGFIDTPFEYLKGADIFVFGSNHEGFPNVLLEAMACGLPIISTNCKAGPSEILEVQNEKLDALMPSEYGTLVPVGNSKLMKEAIVSMTQNKDFKNQYAPHLKKRISDFAIAGILEEYKNSIFNP
ncbi:glycosyltransferase [Flagellimonas allohymeniacidonis]|uniref:Glycosyltransferase n=1 Tax=Flagellimonas allohymeniacidonis TaxID=2517819 RepID=A0A4Q8QDU4_9FLAO|nr:glycosyltransferase [Allomuricauda hymeniacidonis]TAI48571.1 glycosyltransferase [Allomuricauda hymeniacidonis]